MSPKIKQGLARLNPANNAIFWANVRLGGGWPALVIFFFLALGILYLYVESNVYSLPPGPMGVQMAARFLRGFTRTLPFVQELILMGLGTLNVYRAVGRDLQTRMIESNRMMALSPPGAIIGYLLGGMAAPLSAAAGVFCFGLYVYAGAHLPMGHWVAQNLLFLLFVIPIYMTAAMFAMGNRPGWFGLTLLLGILMLVQWHRLVPGTASAGATLYYILGMTPRLPAHRLWLFLGIPVATQCVLSAIFFHGLVRQYRNPHQGAINMTMGALLIAMWATLSTVGISRFHLLISPRFFQAMHRRGPFLISLVSIAFVGLLPVSAAAFHGRRYRPRKVSPAGGLPLPTAGAIVGPAPARDFGRNSSALAVLLTIGVMVAVYCLLAMHPGWHRLPRAGESAGIVLLALVAIFTLQRATYRSGRMDASRVTAIWLLVFWAAPFLLRGMLTAAVRAKWPTAGLHLVKTASCISPMGALNAVWSRHGADGVRVGFISQVAILFLAGLIFSTGERKRNAAALQTQTTTA